MRYLLSGPELEQVLDTLPALCLVLDPAFKIVAQNKAHARATMTKPENTLGKLLFEVFPDNPNDSAADGLSGLRASLTKVMKTREADTMPVLKMPFSGIPTAFMKIAIGGSPTRPLSAPMASSSSSSMSPKT